MVIPATEDVPGGASEVEPKTACHRNRGYIGGSQLPRNDIERAPVGFRTSSERKLRRGLLYGP